MSHSKKQIAPYFGPVIRYRTRLGSKGGKK